MAKREEIRAMRDAWRAYLDLALGFTEASRKQATKVARRLVGKGGATAEQVQSVAEELVKTSLANRESLTRLVRFELDRALGRVGLATAEEVADLTSRVRDLEQRLRAAEATAAAPAGATDGVAQPAAAAKAATAKVPPPPPPAPSEAAKAAPRKASPAPAKKAAAKVAPAASGVAAKKAAPATGGAAAQKAAPAAGGVAAQKAAPVKKAVAKKAVAKKTTGTPAGEAP
jgi:polyhydroxyalkanoate synthesis regulator phasin